MQEINSVFECTICLQEFNIEDHTPKILACGHNICSKAIHTLYDEESHNIKCPVCRKISEYESAIAIPTDCKLITLIQFLKKTTYFNFAPGLVVKEFKEIPKILKKIKQDNIKIKKFFDGKIQRLRDVCNLILEHNEAQLKIVKAYSVLTRKYQESIMIEVEIQKSDASQIVKEKQRQMLIIEQKINKEVAILSQLALKFDQISVLPEKQIELKSVQLLCEGTQKQLQDIGEYQTLIDYKNLINNVLVQIDINEIGSHNYKIVNVTNSKKILEILDKKCQQEDGESQLVMGFLKHHGILVSKNEEEAKILFEQSANAKDARGCYLAFLKGSNFDHLFESCIKDYPNAFNTLGLTNRYQELDKNKIQFILQQLAASKKSSYGQWNTGYNYEKGIGIEKNLDKAALYYKESLLNGVFEAKKYLDDIYEKTLTFKSENPNYKKWAGTYKDFENQTIILL